MDFEFIFTVADSLRFEEMKVIGKTAVLQGREYHFIGMSRQGEEATLYVLTQAAQNIQDMQDGIESDTIRQSFKGQPDNGCRFINSLQVDGLVLEGGHASIGGLGVNDTQCLMLMAKFADAGWRLPSGSMFLTQGWENLELAQYSFQYPNSQLPEWEDAKVRVKWDIPAKRYFIEQGIKITVDDEKAGRSSAQQIAFTLPGSDGRLRSAICYINHVTLIDVWEEEEKRFLDPEYRKRLLEVMEPEQIEEMKKGLHRILEKECPKGMCFLGIEYECTLDVSLNFEAVSYLESKPAVSQGSADILMYHSKPDKETGEHGLRMRASVIQFPLPKGTKEVCAELFSASEIFPQKEEEVKFLPAKGAGGDSGKIGGK